MNSVKKRGGGRPNRGGGKNAQRGRGRGDVGDNRGRGGARGGGGGPPPTLTGKPSGPSVVGSRQRVPPIYKIWFLNEERQCRA